jgi:pimeloyl-ACP methyl ester carboxylesterase
LPYKSAVQLTQRLPGSVLRSIPMAGHAVMLDNPDAVATTILTSCERALSA